MSKPPQKHQNRPAEQRQQNHVVSQSVEIAWSGPIPHPVALEHVDRVIPGGAERLLKMVEQEQLHRLEMSKIAIGAEINDRKLGKYLGTFIAALALVAAAVNSFLGGAWQATATLVGVPILGIVTAFIRGRGGSE